MSWGVPLFLSIALGFGTLVPALRPIGFEMVVAATALVSWAVVAWRVPASFAFSRLAPMAVYLGAYSAMILLPSLAIRLEMPEVGGDWFFPGIAVAVPLSLLGWWLPTRGVGMARDRFAQYYDRPVAIERGSLPLFLWGGLVLLCALLAFVHVQASPVNPIKALLDGASSTELALARERSFKTLPLPGLAYLISWLLSVLLPLSTMYALGRAILEGRWFWRIAAAVTTGGALMYAVFTLAKAPAAMLVAMLFVMAVSVRGRPVPVLKIAGGALVVLLIPTLLVSLISDATIVDSVIGIARRLFYVPAEAAAFYFQAFDSEQPFLAGRSVNLISQLAYDEPPFPIANYIYHIIHPDSVIQTGLSNATYVASMWADYAHFGLLFGPVLVGALLALSELVIVGGEKTLYRVALHAIVCLQAFFLTSRSVTVAMLTGGWIPAIAAVLVIRWLNSRFQRRPAADPLPGGADQAPAVG